MSLQLTASGMAEFELDTMRLPFKGQLRLRPTGIHANKRAGGHLSVHIQMICCEANSS